MPLEQSRGVLFAASDGIHFSRYYVRLGATAMQQHGENHTKQPLKGSIMVVDDDPAFCTFLDDALTDAGYTVHPYTDSVAALAALRAGGALHPDVVLLDLVMPVHTGRDIVTALRAEPDLRAIPVVLI